MQEVIYETPNPYRHDASYKQLFSDARIFVELLQQHVDEPWVRQIVPEALTRIDKEFILHDFREKEADLVYRFERTGTEPILFYFLFELQSTVDQSMPYRLLQYMMELWRGEMRTSTSSHLPLIIPLVLYNGVAPWTAPRQFRDMIAHSVEIGSYCPDFRYYLVDVNRLDVAKLKHHMSLLSAIFLLDRTEKEGVTARIYDVLQSIGDLPAQDRFQLVNWLKQLYRHRLAADNKTLLEQWLDKWQEGVNEMPIEWNFPKWYPEFERERLAELEREAKEKGWKEGIEQGLEQGIEQGKKQGIERGIERGIKQGLEQGRLAEKQNMARQLKQLGQSLQLIETVTGLTADEINQL